MPLGRTETHLSLLAVMRHSFLCFLSRENLWPTWEEQGGTAYWLAGGAVWTMSAVAGDCFGLLLSCLAKTGNTSSEVHSFAYTYKFTKFLWRHPAYLSAHGELMVPKVLKHLLPAWSTLTFFLLSACSQLTISCWLPPSLRQFPLHYQFCAAGLLAACSTLLWLFSCSSTRSLPRLSANRLTTSHLPEAPSQSSAVHDLHSLLLVLLDSLLPTRRSCYRSCLICWSKCIVCLPSTPNHHHHSHLTAHPRISAAPVRFSCQIPSPSHLQLRWYNYSRDSDHCCRFYWPSRHSCLLSKHEASLIRGESRSISHLQKHIIKKY